MRPRHLTPEQLQAVCDAWNRANAVGVPVWYRDDNRQTIATATRHEAFVLSGHTAVIFVDGKGGCVALERVTVRP